MGGKLTYLRIKAQFTENIRALIRTQDPDQRKQLPVPYEYIIWKRCKQHGSLPLPGGELNQPHLMMMAFDIIEHESDEWEVHRKRIEEVTRKQQEQWNAEHGKK